MPYCVVIWRRGTLTVDIAGLKPEDLKYLEEIPCLSYQDGSDQEGFIRFGPSSLNRCTDNGSGNPPIKIAVVLTGLEVLGFKVVTSTATPCSNLKGTTMEYSWTLRREFSEPEPQD